MKYIISDKGYFYKINKSGKKRISRDEYLKNNKQKGGINHSNLSNGQFNNNHFEMLFGRNFDITRINGYLSQEQVDNYFEENFGITSEETIDEMLTYFWDNSSNSKTGFTDLEELCAMGWLVDIGNISSNSVLKFFETPTQKEKLVKFLKKDRIFFTNFTKYVPGGKFDRAITKSLVSTVLPNTNNINKSCYIKIEGTNNRDNILIPKNIVNHSILLKEMIKNNNNQIPTVEIPSNFNMTGEQLKSAMHMIKDFYLQVKQRINSINAETIHKHLVKHFEIIIDNNKNDMINILKLTNYLQFISLQQNIFIVFRELIQNPKKSFNIIDILYKSDSVNLQDFDEMINMIFPTVENRKLLDYIFQEFNNENRKESTFMSLQKKVYANTSMNLEDE